MKEILLQFLAFGILTIVVAVDQGHVKKRQIYREQVSPSIGGKVPESAFQADRLALNRLQKEGIAVPDGVLLEQRPHQVYPFSERTKRPTFRVLLKPSQRYTPDEGKYHGNEVSSVESTYPVEQFSTNHVNVRPTLLFKPVRAPLQLPHPEIHDHLNYQAPHTHVQDVGYAVQEDFYHPPPPSHPIQPHPQYVSAVDHFSGSSYVSWSPYFGSDYIAKALFNDFETFFDNFNSHSFRRLRQINKDN